MLSGCTVRGHYLSSTFPFVNTGLQNADQLKKKKGRGRKDAILVESQDWRRKKETRKVILGILYTP